MIATAAYASAILQAYAAQIEQNRVVIRTGLAKETWQMLYSGYKPPVPCRYCSRTTQKAGRKSCDGCWAPR